MPWKVISYYGHKGFIDPLLMQLVRGTGQPWIETLGLSRILLYNVTVSCK